MQNLPEPTEASSTEAIPTVVSTESTTESQTTTVSSSQTVQINETADASLPYRLEADEELDLSSLSDQAKSLRYDKFYQENLVFQYFYPELSEDHALFKKFFLDSEDQISRYKELYTEPLQRSISINGTEESAANEYQQAIDLINNMTELYPLDDYVYLAACSYYSQYWSKYTTYLGNDIVVDGEMLKLIRRYETSDYDKYLQEEVPSLAPPHYLWIAAVPREFLSEDNYTIS